MLLNTRGGRIKRPRRPHQDGGRQAARTRAVIRLLLHNGLRVDEVCQVDVADLGYDRGHRTLTVIRKGGRPARVHLAPSTAAAIDAYLTDRGQAAGSAARPVDRAVARS